LEGPDGRALYNPADEWKPTSVLKQSPGASKAILAMGATAMLGRDAAADLSDTDVIVVNGLPFGEGEMESLIKKYHGGLVTVEDGIIGHAGVGLRGFASLVHSSAAGRVPVAHVGITDPSVAPSEGHMEVWEHFGLTATAVKEAVDRL